jgi:Rrf2 family nitric oxide-sensitive transcriptional repressor
MRLSLHTDFSLRVLMYLGSLEPAQLATTPVIAERFDVSVHHLQKVVQTLRKLGLIETVQGHGGGMRLAVPAAGIRLGSLVRLLESTGMLVDCGRGPCPLAGCCALKGALDEAEAAFFDKLDQSTLADALAPRTRARLHVLHRTGVTAA